MFKDKDWFPQGTFDNYIMKGTRLNFKVDIHGVFHDSTNDLMGYAQVQSLPTLIQNEQYYHLQNIHINPDYHHQGALSSLLFFLLSCKHIKLYTDHKFIDTRDVIKKLHNYHKISLSSHEQLSLISSDIHIQKGFGYHPVNMKLVSPILRSMTLFRNELTFDPEINIWD